MEMAKLTVICFFNNSPLGCSSSGTGLREKDAVHTSGTFYAISTCGSNPFYYFILEEFTELNMSPLSYQDIHFRSL